MTRWPAVLLLLLVYALSFVDRQILGLLVDQVRGDLGATDVQMGLLMGPAFGVFYALLGMPCGWLADRVRRTRLIALGLVLWTGATMASGLAQNFGALALARMVVGVGEAALVPAAVSMIADAFGPRERALPLAVFTAGISVGAGLALLLGGALVTFAAAGLRHVPLVGGWLGTQAPWRSVLILAGAAGVPFALVLLIWPEPARAMRLADGVAPEGLAAFLYRRRALFAPLLLATSLLYVLSNGWSAWLPSLFIRQFGWAPAVVGTRLGAAVLVCALGGTLASGLLAAALAWRGRSDATLIVMTAGAALLVPTTLAAALAGSASASLAGVAAAYVALALCFGVATAGLVATTPAALRGRMTALYLLLGNLAGLGLGPPVVGLLLERGLADAARVGTALALVALATAPLAVLLLERARRRFVAIDAAPA